MSGLLTDKAANGLARTSLGGGLTGYLGERVLSKTSIENSVRDLIAVEKHIILGGHHTLEAKKDLRNLIWVTLTNGL